MHAPSLTPRGTPAQWCIVVLLAVIATTLLIATVQALTPVAAAQPVSNGGEPEATFAVAGQIAPNTFGLYLVDPSRQTVLLYEVATGFSQNAATRKLVLRAARTYRFDAQLEEYNTEPKPGEIADQVRTARPIEPAGRLDGRPDPQE